MKNNHTKQAGFTLIEVLITVMVLSIGLLGLAALQTVGMKNTSNAYYRSQATVLGNAFIERMRANSTAVDNDQYQAVDSDPITCNNLPNPYCARHGGNAAQACNANQMATFDIYTISCGLPSGALRLGGIKDVLPDSRLTVTCIDNNVADPDPCTSNSNHVLTLNWNETEDNNTVAKTVTMTFTP